MTEGVQLSVVIVTFNSEQYIENCILSLEHLVLKNGVKVVVVDNASSDRTLEIVGRHSWVSLVPLKENLGFGTANNIGCRHISADYYFLLNADAFLNPDVDMFRVINFMQSEKDVAVCGLKMVYPDGATQTSSYTFSSAGKWLVQVLPGFYRFMRLVSALGLGKVLAKVSKKYSSYRRNHQLIPPNYDTVKVDWVCGAAMLVSGEYIEEFGLFDENIFLYGEDEDVCLMAKARGRRIIEVNSPPIVHVHGWNSSNRFSPVVAALKFDSLEYFIKKHYSGTFGGSVMKFLLPIYVFGFGRNLAEFLREKYF
ncbi:glycosyltransferase family 2 protein [Pseudomaricurvus sp. HS19]|uniref:glycosyltransferase family 2 protein n=1 Tax=Pseudomaricurvus sp. HS19 TaxID=2692626 RepID=UPI00136FE862|nr:glycosyltransferase family 2 protein [Pseudomaricurvus sp. HS19]MYM65131.1 glycosyltransferase [Pseudomaricurvus sp. HS19]